MARFPSHGVAVYHSGLLWRYLLPVRNKEAARKGGFARDVAQPGAGLLRPLAVAIVESEMSGEDTR